MSSGLMLTAGRATGAAAVGPFARMADGFTLTGEEERERDRCSTTRITLSIDSCSVFVTSARSARIASTSAARAGIAAAAPFAAATALSSSALLTDPFAAAAPALAATSSAGRGAGATEI
jgi:hypothetical protein